MLPGLGLNPKKMQKMMQQMGMSFDEIKAKEVIIVKEDGTELHIQNPQITKMNVQGKDMYQIMGNASEEPGSGGDEDDDDDVEMVASGAGVSPDTAREALKEAHGDIAKAILDLEEE